jgi:hypothetical protein
MTDAALTLKRSSVVSTRRLMVLVVLLVVGGAGACDRAVVMFEPMPIATLLDSATRFEGKPVVTEGVVLDVLKVPLLKERFYTVGDSSGRILIVSYDELPLVGDRVRVSGRFENVAILGGRVLAPHITVGRAR